MSRYPTIDSLADHIRSNLRKLHEATELTDANSNVIDTLNHVDNLAEQIKFQCKLAEGESIKWEI